VIAAKMDDSVYLVDLNAAAGDWLWKKGGSKRKTAAEAYTAAMLEAMKIDVKTSIEVAAHFVSRLVFSGDAERTALHRAVKAWIGRQDGAEGLSDFVGWPFDAADPIATIVAAGKMPTSAAISKALTRAFEYAVASSRPEQPSGYTAASAQREAKCDQPMVRSASSPTP
jgi:hypothetical protein